MEMHDPIVNEEHEHTHLKPREKARRVLHDKRTHIAIIVLIVIEVIVLLAVLLIDLDAIPIQGKDEHEIEEKKHKIESILHYTSIAIISLFVVEILIKLFVERRHFLKQKFEVFDAAVVFITFLLDIAMLFTAVSLAIMDAVSFIIILRLWRFFKILASVNYCVRVEIHEKLDHERELRMQAEREVEHLKEVIENLKHSAITDKQQRTRK